MNPSAQVALVVRLETIFYRRHPKLLLAALAVALIPALYVLIYLSSVWDPAAHTGALPVALVNLDRDVEYREQTFNLGREVTAKLRADRLFGYVDLDDAEAARRQVREGRLAFALIVPADFSSNAIPGADPGAGRLEIYTSEGNNYQSAALARRFADDLGHDINERLNERRWALVLRNAAGSQRSVDRLHEAVAQLQTGSRELAAGSKQAASGADSLRAGVARFDQGIGRQAAGLRELGGGLRALEAKQPPAADLQRLKAGADALVGGHAELGRGLVDLQTASQRLGAGVRGFQDEVSSSFLLGGAADGAAQLAEGLGRLDAGLGVAIAGQRKLADGSAQVAEGVGALTAGAQAQGAALHGMVGALPAEGQLEELVAGSGKLATAAAALAEGNRKLEAGARQLAGGVDLLADAMPDRAPGMEGSAEGLANSVRPRVVADAAVPNNGSAYAPNLIPAALWLGAGIAAFLVHVRVMPREAREFSRIAQLLGKIAVPAGVVLLQALLVMLASLWVLHVEVANLGAFALTLAVSALTFLVIVFALTRAIGDAGKALSILFLAVQLSSSGGIIPVELSGGLYAELSPWLPLTWVVKAMKAAMFGAFENAWQSPLLLVAAIGAAGALLASVVGSWRYVEQAAIRPSVDF